MSVSRRSTSPLIWLLGTMIAVQGAWGLLAEATVNPTGIGVLLGLGTERARDTLRDLLTLCSWSPVALVGLLGCWSTFASRSAFSHSAGAPFVRWVLPAHSAWSLAELLPSVRAAAPLHADYAQHLARLRLNHPWPTVGAVMAALVLAMAAAFAGKTQPRKTLGVLALFAALRALLEGSALWVAHAVLDGLGAARLEPLAHFAFPVSLALSGVFVLVAAWLTVRAPAAWRTSAAAALALALLTTFDVTRLPVLQAGSSLSRLDALASSPGPDADAPVGDAAVPPQLAMVDAAGNVTMLDEDRVYALGPTQRLPARWPRLMLIPDAALPVAKLRALIEGAVQPFALRVGRCASFSPSSMYPCTSSALRAVTWIGVIDPSTEALLSFAPTPVQELETLPPDLAVQALHWDRPLRTHSTGAKRSASSAKPGRARNLWRPGALHLYEPF